MDDGENEKCLATEDNRSKAFLKLEMLDGVGGVGGACSIRFRFRVGLAHGGFSETTHCTQRKRNRNIHFVRPPTRNQCKRSRNLMMANVEANNKNS